MLLFLVCLQDLGRSLRNVFSASVLSYILVRDIFHTDLNYKPSYLVQKLSSEDMDRTLEFIETIMELSERRPYMFSKLTLSDDAKFHLFVAS